MQRIIELAWATLAAVGLVSAAPTAWAQTAITVHPLTPQQLLAQKQDLLGRKTAIENEMKAVLANFRKLYGLEPQWNGICNRLTRQEAVDEVMGHLGSEVFQKYGPRTVRGLLKGSDWIEMFSEMAGLQQTEFVRLLSGNFACRSKLSQLLSRRYADMKGLADDLARIDADLAAIEKRLQSAGPGQNQAGGAAHNYSAYYAPGLKLCFASGTLSAACEGLESPEAFYRCAALYVEKIYRMRGPLPEGLFRQRFNNTMDVVMGGSCGRQHAEDFIYLHKLLLMVEGRS